MSDLLSLYIAIAAMLAIVSASVLAHFFFLLMTARRWAPRVWAWTSHAATSIVRAAWRGVAQVWRLAVPKRPEVPRARVRRRR